MIDSFTGRYRFLSNFFPCKIILNGFTYPSVEHAYQAAKSLDMRLRKLFMWNELTPGDVKYIGRILPLRRDWDSVKDKVMEDCLRRKFGRDGLRSLLLATNDEELVEGNTWDDIYWGICRGKGQNKLGKLLMKIRSELKDGTS